ncbi:alpha-2-macroglobulin family protein [Aestuariivivens sediminis]|uniref:alpha-2-macroglobulin family protein n=1 Tax=Aestuariivivens sediminis TaxID=2913557 RepID=UPI001F55F8CC|nr:MG2 domain-containing protein [Aestuariivivens sediminis]
MKIAISLLLFLLLPLHINAQSKDYKNLWAEVAQFEKGGLPKSALKVVMDINKKALKDDNIPQFIKTLLYKSKFALVLEDDAQLNIIKELRFEIDNRTFPAKHILQSILANLYWQYFSAHRWSFYNRTKTAEKVNHEDFRTWDLQTLFNEIHTLYQNSLENGQRLQGEDLKRYDLLLDLRQDSKLYRPTQYDFLNHRALEFYKSDDTQITNPAYKFEMDSPKYFDQARSFSTLNLSARDSLSLQRHALEIYQNLITFHLKDRTSLALADVNIGRLKFVAENSTLENKDSLLLEALKEEKAQLTGREVSGLYDFEMASLYYEQSRQYQPEIHEEQRWNAREAMIICEAVMRKFPHSKAAEKCRDLKTKIEQQTLQITTERFIPIQNHGRLLLRYKNLNTLHFEVFKLNRAQLETWNKLHRKEEQLDFIHNLEPHEKWDTPLRNEKDYQTHTTEVVIPRLDHGTYLIFASNSHVNNPFAHATIQVTNMALVESESKNHKTFQVIDRTNGAPLSGARVELTFYENNDRTPQQELVITNGLGEFQIEKTKDRYRNISVRMSHGNDTAYVANYYVNRPLQTEKEGPHFKAFIFTDRSIYRPGQTVYFKAIAMSTKNGTSEVVADEPVQVVLYNTNGEELNALEFKTNAFGSVSGEFILPSKGLNGEYHIEFDGNETDFFTEHYFSVEAYKRPKFETLFAPITETFKINDSVTVKGTARAYAGSTITNAKVVYRVHRKVQYPQWYYWSRPYFYSKPQEITHGEGMTNEKGEFEITFKALPDHSVDESHLPIFNYEVTVDVTDLNGETRTATTIVNVGYHSLTVQLDIDPKLDKTKKDHNISIDSKNLNGEFVPTRGLIKIYKLKAPNTVLRPRPWAAPDYQDISETDFKTLFPHEAYTNENDPNYWENGALVFEKTFDTHTSKEVHLGNIKSWESGAYRITLDTQDKFGKPVRNEIKTTLYSTTDKTLADRQLFSMSTDKTHYKVGESVQLTMASAAHNLTVRIQVEKAHRMLNTQIITLSNNKKTIAIPVESNDVGGFSVHYSYAAFNSFQSGTLTVLVPYPKTALTIETTTFRDRMQPGTEEEWSFKIKGPHSETVSAELLASMYDASLDQFKSHQWLFQPTNYPNYSPYRQSNAYRSFGITNFNAYHNSLRLNNLNQDYDQLNWFGLYFGSKNNYLMKALQGQSGGIQRVEEDTEVEGMPFAHDHEASLEEVVVTGYQAESEEDRISNKPQQPNGDTSIFKPIPTRKNLRETAFFFPYLKTDNEGHVSFKFTVPEVLTQWNLQLLAYTKTLQSATKTLTTVTQKELMLTPNAPRFLREGDTISISTKIANLTQKVLTGQAAIQLFDAVSGLDITHQLLIQENRNEQTKDDSRTQNIRSFVVQAKDNQQVSWQLHIPNHVQAVQYKIIGTSGNFNDGEQNTLPVLSNRTLVTETLPMWVRSNETRDFELEKLKTGSSSSLKHHKLTLEMTSNPAWYAVQALPYLMEYPYACNEQIFSRYYANALASHIALSNPRIQEVFNMWATQQVLLSNLEKNQELKSILIQETPWLRDAQSETEQKKRMALLFDLNKMNSELQSSLRQLKTNQTVSGAWAWFNGGRENRYITQHIMSGFGHLIKLGVLSTERETPEGQAQYQMMEKAIAYLDHAFVKDYEAIKKYDDKVDLNKDHLSYSQLHYLYMRSFFPQIKVSQEVRAVMTYYHSQIQKYWLKQPLYAKGLMALISYRNDDKSTAKNILKSLQETSITDEEMGMYWKSNRNSLFWYQAPIETQALLIETFSEAGSILLNEPQLRDTIDHLKIWLLKNKQTHSWKTTKATTEAVYALLLQGSEWIGITDAVDVMVGHKKIDPSIGEDVKVEAGSGYFKTSWDASEITPEMGHVRLSKRGTGLAWGSLYWQYFEDLDKITRHETPLSLTKTLFLRTYSDYGEEISEITNSTHLEIGDLVRVRIELRTDRDMEFVHMKDMRASGLEPVNVRSQYKWQDGLGYYESTKDASTNFFFDNLPQGVYVFEYDLRVNHAGNMSNGITSIQSMYAPEFSSHSTGIRIRVK